jgi:glycosyltransferase involved in cell wall biosynthesis
MRFSIIIPSYNQSKFIEATIKNVVSLKTSCAQEGIDIEVIVFDNCSVKEVRAVLENYRQHIDVLKIEEDKGQYDAINKGMDHVTGEYWTWLNTDDLIDVRGFVEIANYLKTNKPDYIYGDIEIIDENGLTLHHASSGEFTLHSLTHLDASISQPGSFFKTEFTYKIGKLRDFKFAFDYEYVLRILKNGGQVIKINRIAAQFRYYKNSKSGSQDARFLIEQLNIAKEYGSPPYSRLSLLLNLRILKRKLFN